MQYKKIFADIVHLSKILLYTLALFQIEFTI
jgi:hypothetical protein